MLSTYRLKSNLNYLLIVALWLVLSLNLTYGQYVSDDGSINHELIIRDISELEHNSLAQDERISIIVQDLRTAIIEFYPKSNGKALADSISKYRNELQFRMGRFAYLGKTKMNYEMESAPETDTVSSEIIVLIARSQILRDSIKAIEAKLMEVVLDTNETRASKEVAVSELVKIESLSVIEFVFSKNKNLEFFDYTNNNLWHYIDEGCFACDRTGLWKMFLQGNGFNREKLDRNWSVLPFVIEYFDTDSRYTSGYSIEDLIIRGLLSGYSHPWLVTDFIYLNMENKASEPAQRYKLMYDVERKKYSQKGNNND